MSSNTIKYLAYGSNLSQIQMSERCPSNPQYLYSATISGYRLIINNRGVANIVQDPTNQIMGIIYSITKEDIEQLDRHEGIKNNIYQKEILQTTTGELVMTYIDHNNTTEGTIRPEYKKRMERALEEAKKVLPKEYIEGLMRRLHA